MLGGGRFPRMRRSAAATTPDMPADVPTAPAPDHELRTVEQLPNPPSVGRLADTWRQRVAIDGWAQPAVASDFGELGGFRVAAASHVGRKHADEGKSRQDAYAFALAGPRLICALADGVSQSRYAAPAADVTVSVSVATLAGRLAEGAEVGEAVLREAIDRAGASIGELMGRLSPEWAGDPAECASTLVLVVLERTGDRLIVTCASVGDSAAFTVSAEGQLEGLLGVEGGDSREPLRDYLPKRTSKVIMVEAVLAPDTTVVLSSDGLVRDLVRSEMVRTWVADRLLKVDSALGAGHLLGYSRRGSSDDRTYVAARLREAVDD